MNFTADTHPRINIPDDIRQRLEDGAHVVINVSGGKDSDAMAIALTALRYRNNHLNPRRQWTGRFILVHADVGRMEWKESKPHCEQLAENLNTEFVVVRNEKRDLLQAIEERAEKRPDSPPFPSSACRYCTSDFKRAPIAKWIRNEFPQDAVVISAMGLRAEESPARAKRPVTEPNKHASAPTKNREVINWNPILDWTLEDVWATIGLSLDRLRDYQNEWKEHPSDELKEEFEEIAHVAYLYGNERVSCAICVLASLNDIQNGIEHNPELYDDLCKIERKSGFDFRKNLSLSELQ